MPLPSAEVVDAYLRPVLGAARTADPSLISNVDWGMARRGVHSYEGETGLWQGGPVRNSA